MKVSIITATYNSFDTLQSTLKSIESQDYDNIEYIIVDGKSNDDTMNLVNKYSHIVNKVICEEDKGIYDALNKGIGVATGDIIGFLHSDDVFYDSSVISDIVKLFKSSNCEAVYGDLQYVSKDNLEHVVRMWKSGDYDVSKLRFGWMPPHPTFFMKSEVYKKLGVFDLFFKISADYDSLLRYLCSGRISLSYLPRILVKMRVGGVSNRSLRNILKKTKEDIFACKNNNIYWPVAVFLKNIRKIQQFILK